MMYYFSVCVRVCNYTTTFITSYYSSASPKVYRVVPRFVYILSRLFFLGEDYGTENRVTDNKRN